MNVRELIKALADFEPTNEVVFGKVGAIAVPIADVASKNASGVMQALLLEAKPQLRTRSLRQKKRKRSREKVSKLVVDLILWRDGCALDWAGEDLVYHLAHVLKTFCMVSGNTPPEHLDGLREYMLIPEEDRLDLITRVLRQKGLL